MYIYKSIDDKGGKKIGFKIRIVNSRLLHLRGLIFICSKFCFILIITIICQTIQIYSIITRYCEIYIISHIISFIKQRILVTVTDNNENLRISR